MCSVCFFFFKQKTAYEMRISDWSSDVCSSDLLGVSALWLLAQLPWWLQRLLGTGLGGLFYLALPKRRRIAARNLELCFPEFDGTERKRQIGRASCRERVGQAV